LKPGGPSSAPARTEQDSGTAAEPKPKDPKDPDWGPAHAVGLEWGAPGAKAARAQAPAAPAPLEVGNLFNGADARVDTKALAPRQEGEPPRSVGEAFDDIKATSSGHTQMRRHVDNVMAWNMKWDLLTKAEKSLDFTYYTIERDPYGYAYLGGLIDARYKGVDVKGLVDESSNARGHGFTSPLLGESYLKEVAGSGAKLGVYDSLSTRFKSLEKDGLTYKLLSGLHDKFAVADAGTEKAEGETGGRNVARPYHQNPEDNPASWRDDSVQFKGSVTDGLVTALRRELEGPAVALIKPSHPEATRRSSELLVAYQMMDSWMKAPPLTADQRGKLGLAPAPEGTALTEAEKTQLRETPDAKNKLADMLLEEAIAKVKQMPEVPADVKGKLLDSIDRRLVSKLAHELVGDLELRGSRKAYDALGGYNEVDMKIVDQVGAADAAPGQRFNEIADALKKLVRSAKSEIVIQNPYVVMNEVMMKELEDASKRGVKIVLVTNSPASTDSAITQGFFLNGWKAVEERLPTARIFVALGQRKLHAKTFVVDGEVTGDTTYNTDLLSAKINGEIGALTRSPESAQDLLGAIYNDLRNPANKFSEWKIQRDENGAPVHDAKGQPIAAHGPRDDLSLKLRAMYVPIQSLSRLIADIGAPELRIDKPQKK
jgi:phosphatidylserine/phosphatidylglycerophosphate/cardiolipin synthase-like enzyme